MKTFFCFLAICVFSISTCSSEEPPFSKQDLQSSISRGVEYLIKNQNKDGSWGDAGRTKDLNIYAPVPGAHLAFRAAVSALAFSALIDTNQDSKDRVDESLGEAYSWLIKNLPRLRRATPDTIYNIWAHAYGIQALHKAKKYYSSHPDRQIEISQAISLQLKHLLLYEAMNSGWGYYAFGPITQKPDASTSSFLTSTVLIALHDAGVKGDSFSQKVIDRALVGLARLRKKDGSYIYGDYMRTRPMHQANQLAGSLGRSQVGNLALYLYENDQVGQKEISVSLDRFFKRKGWLDIGRKRPVPHEAWFSVAGYYFYYGNYYASRCIGLLPSEEKPELYSQLAKLLCGHQEKNGSWWDYPLYNYHYAYGTAFALMSLQNCLELK